MANYLISDEKELEIHTYPRLGAPQFISSGNSSGTPLPLKLYVDNVNNHSPAIRTNVWSIVYLTYGTVKGTQFDVEITHTYDETVKFWGINFYGNTIISGSLESNGSSYRTTFYNGYPILIFVAETSF